MHLSKHSFLLLPCVSLFMLTSCKKEDQKIPPTPVIPKVKTITAGSDIRTYSYDSKGRITGIVYAYGKQDYAYTDTGIVSNYYDQTDTWENKTVYKLDSKGLVISSTNTASPTDQSTYSYDSDGQVLASDVIRTIPNDPVRHWHYQYHYTGNNADSLITTMTTNDIFSGGTTQYYDEYYTDMPNTLGNANFGQAFLGASSKNMVKLARDQGHTSTGFLPQSIYTYEVDSLNRVTKVMQGTVGSSGMFSPISYTYY